MNKVILMGRLTRDPNVRYTQQNGSQESKKAAGEQAENAGYSDTGDGFMNIPDDVDGELPFM